MLAACPAARADEPKPLAEALAAAVDLPTPKDRAAAAAALATRADADLPSLLAACRGFGSFERVEPGAATQTVRLFVVDAVEPAEVATYVPKGYAPGTPAPLMLALHGAGGSGPGEAPRWTAVAEALGMLVVAPTGAGASGGYGFTERERRAALAALRWARRRFDVDENRVFVAGESRGGHMAWDLALRNPGLFAAVVPMIGAPRVKADNGQNNLRFVENLVATPIRDLMGAKDDQKAVANVRLAFERLKALGAKDAVLVEFPEQGHDFDFGAVDWATFLGPLRRDPAASRVVRRAATAGEGRALWAEILAVDPAVTEVVAPAQPPGWERMSAEAQRKWLEAEVERRTARLEVTRKAPGAFVAQGAGVRRFRLLLPEGAFDAKKPVAVTFNGATVSRAATPLKAVLLADFVERFDRTLLPVAEVLVP